MRPLLHKAVAIAFLTLLLLWVIGLFVAPAPASPPATPPHVGSVFTREDFSRQQVANNVRALHLEDVPAPLLLDRADADAVRVHEKSAHLTASSAAFDDDEKQVRLAVAGQEGIVLNERSSGVAGQRTLALEISVRPERFDELASRLRQIGQLQTVSVSQRDRTDEFRRLRAKKQHLEKQRDEVAKAGEGKLPSVEDKLRVLQSLREIDRELQTVVGQVGDLLGKESYYNVYLTLSEEAPATSTQGVAAFPRRAGHALLWALPWWCVVLVLMGLGPATFASVKALLPRRGPTP